MNHEVKEISFYNDNLIGVKDEENQIWLGIKQTCLNIGLSDGQARRQVENLKTDLVFKGGVTNLRYLTKGGVQETACIKEDFVTLWLAKIRLTPAMQRDNPEAVDKLIRYQLEAQKVLHNAFMGTKKTQLQFYDSIGLANFMTQLDTRLTAHDETMETCAAIFQNMMDFTTINYRQQQEILQAGKDRVNRLLGGAHSELYKEKSRMYFKNMWLQFCEHFGCGTYKDLNPLFVESAKDWLNEWDFK